MVFEQAYEESADKYTYEKVSERKVHERAAQGSKPMREQQVGASV